MNWESATIILYRRSTRWELTLICRRQGVPGDRHGRVADRAIARSCRSGAPGAQTANRLTNSLGDRWFVARLCSRVANTPSQSRFDIRPISAAVVISGCILYALAGFSRQHRPDPPLGHRPGSLDDGRGRMVRRSVHGFSTGRRFCLGSHYFYSRRYCRDRHHAKSPSTPADHHHPGRGKFSQ